MPKSAHRVTIKRYGKDRLYDTGKAAYVTAAELAASVDDGEEIVVHDAKTGEDITDFILAKQRFH
jgi:polyhydroxyalkanoate synthesis regulator protein